MSNNENWLFQVSPKLPDGTLINLRGANPEEFGAVIDWATENAAKLVAVNAAIQAVNGVAPLAGNTARTQVQQEAPPAQQQSSGWGAPQGQQPPSFANPATQGPACKHGPMVARSGTGAKGPWSGFFCPTPKGTSDQCPPQFNRR